MDAEFGTARSDNGDSDVGETLDEVGDEIAVKRCDPTRGCEVGQVEPAAWPERVRGERDEKFGDLGITDIAVPYDDLDAKFANRSVPNCHARHRDRFRMERIRGRAHDALGLNASTARANYKCDAASRERNCTLSGCSIGAPEIPRR